MAFFPRENSQRAMSTTTTTTVRKNKTRSRKKASPTTVVVTERPKAATRRRRPPVYLNPRTELFNRKYVSAGARSVTANKELNELMLLAPHGEKAMVEAYLRCLMNPTLFMSRIPDADTRASSLIRSTQEISIPAFFDNTADSGRFSLVTKPTLGSIDSPIHYKTAVVNYPASWSTHDWTDPGTYMSAQNNADPRIDLFAPIITQPNSFFFQMAGGAGLTALRPFGTAPTYSPYNYALNIMYSSTTGTITLPLGSFFVLVEYKDAGAAVVVPTITNGTAIATFTLIGDVNENDLQSEAYAVEVMQAGTVLITAAGSDGITSSELIITPAYYQGLPNSQAGGMVKLIRPVAQSVLFTKSMAPILSGGYISAAYVPASTCSTNYFSNNGNSATSVAQLQNWEALAEISGSPHNGEYKLGAYVWWAPESIGNNIFVRPDAQNADNYPCLIVSGQVDQGPGGSSGSQLVGRVIITTVYEILTNSTLLESYPTIGSQAVIDCATRILTTHRHAMGNAAHVPWFKKAMATLWDTAKSIGKFAYENREAIGSIAKAGMVAI